MEYEYTLEEFEKKCDEIRSTNQELLRLFEADMRGLSEKTIRRHLDNADFYINGYLLLHDPLTMEKGLNSVSIFLDDYYMRKCAGTEGTRKEMAASIKKFYRCMKDHGKISEGDFEILCDDIREITSERNPAWEE